MSKLTTVRTALDSNDEALVLDAEEHLYLPNADGYWTHTVDIIVVPRDGIYSVEKLQDFMIGLVPIEPTSKDAFRGGDNHMYFGKLYFDEAIGTEVVSGSRTITITDPDVKLPDSLENGAMTIDLGRTIERKRRTWVRVYPDHNYAVRAMDGRDVYETDRFYPPRRSLTSIVKRH